VRTSGRPNDYGHRHRAKRGHSQVPAATPYLNGITPRSGTALDNDIKHAANGVTVSDPYYVTFNSLLVALYDLDDNFGGNPHGQGIGQEVTDQVTGTPQPDSHVHYTQVLDHYYQVTVDSQASPQRVYHVVTG
jgi:hypothetical protein